jgi:hypothetical protein
MNVGLTQATSRTEGEVTERAWQAFRNYALKRSAEERMERTGATAFGGQDGGI